MSPVEPQAVSKKRGPLFWILGCAGVALILLLMLVGVLFYGFRSFQQRSGVDAQMLRENPNFAIVKIGVAANPDFEIVSENPEAAEVRVRSKSTGKQFIQRIDRNTKGFVSIPVEESSKEKAK
ncbi:MAG: hypothetical protein ABI811_00245 [Acidobacteriota bacterium]